MARERRERRERDGRKTAPEMGCIVRELYTVLSLLKTFYVLRTRYLVYAGYTHPFLVN